MSLQQTLALVRVHHLFWENELRRAPREERDACEFFRQQVQNEIAVLSDQAEAAKTYRAGFRLPHPQSDEQFSAERPRTEMMRRLP
jgi:hypothetical protein